MNQVRAAVIKKPVSLFCLVAVAIALMAAANAAHEESVSSPESNFTQSGF